MLKSYLLTALRNIGRNKISSIINIAGLALGIASCIFIFLYVNDELNYDKHHPKADRTYRLNITANFQGQVDRSALSSMLVGPTLAKEYPEIEQSTRLFNIGKQTIWYQDKVYNEENMFFADSNFFDVFAYNFVKGNPKTALTQPRNIVITEELAQKYFGNEDPIGKQLKFTKNFFTVTGVVKEPEQPSHIKAGALLSFVTIDTTSSVSPDEDWLRLAVYTFVVFKNKINIDEFTPKLSAFYDKYITPYLKRFQLNSSMKYSFQPLKDIHLTTDLSYDVESNNNRSYVYIFSVVAIFILLIACINYMNMATARAARRAKEVGIRKVMGASRNQLVWQFLGESVLTTLFALILALALVEIFLPYFNSLADKNFAFHILFSGKMLWFILLTVITVGLIGGSYPALFLSSFKPVNVLKSQKIPGGFSAGLRKALVVFQFAISVILVIGTLVVFAQMKYMKNTPLGFDKEQTVDIPGHKTGTLLFFIDRNGKPEEKGINFNFVDENALQMLDIPLVKGRYFSKDFAGDDTAAFIVNEAAVKMLGLKEPIGQMMENGLGFKGPIVGVVKDFHYQSLQNKIEPLVLMKHSQPNGHLLAKLSGNNISETLGFIEQKWKNFAPDRPMEYYFLDQEFNKQYAKEEKLLTIFGYFSALTIERGQYLQNVMRANAWWYNYEINKLGKPVDRTEWD
ncbi:MAG: FtsX-like permease family protein, partial [Sphingobacteriales bacterium]